MRLTFDPKYNIAYIQLRPKRGRVRPVQVSDELNVDVAADGTIYGIELLNANEQTGRLEDLCVPARRGVSALRVRARRGVPASSAVD